MKSKTYSQLQELFIKGTSPDELDGFYKGSLDLFIPQGRVEKIAGFVANFWLPWYGKEFNKKNNSGDNLLPAMLESFLRSRYGDKPLGTREGNRIHAFPFQTKITKALQDPIQVLQLNYNLPSNPEKVREVIDELAEIDKNVYLGKAYLKKENDYRLVAFFSLKK